MFVCHQALGDALRAEFGDDGCLGEELDIDNSYSGHERTASTWTLDLHIVSELGLGHSSVATGLVNPSDDSMPAAQPDPRSPESLSQALSDDLDIVATAGWR